jgi:hypothetical protein
MAYIKMTNYAGQIFKDMNISAPAGAYVFDANTKELIALKEKTVFRTIGNNRLGIGRYRINMLDANGRAVYCHNYMMDDNDKPYHAIWSLEDRPYTPEMIYNKYGYKVGPDGQRIKKYKLSGRMRTIRFAKELRELGRHLDADRIMAEMKESIANGKRYMIYRKDLFPESCN